MSEEDIKEFHNLDKSGWWEHGNNKYWTPLYRENETNWQSLENEKKR